MISDDFTEPPRCTTCAHWDITHRPDGSCGKCENKNQSVCKGGYKAPRRSPLADAADALTAEGQDLGLEY